MLVGLQTEPVSGVAKEHQGQPQMHQRDRDSQHLEGKSRDQSMANMVGLELMGVMEPQQVQLHLPPWVVKTETRP